MDPDSPKPGNYGKILEEHLALQTPPQQIARALASQTASIAEVSDLLAKLGDDLVKHFALEEDGGYFSEALLRAPQLLAKANELVAQHPKMCTLARDLVDLGPVQKGDQWWQETRQRFQAFKTELLKHERHEDQLLQEAYTQDLGSHD